MMQIEVQILTGELLGGLFILIANIVPNIKMFVSNKLSKQMAKI